MEGKEAFDRTCQIRSIEIKEGDLVLRHDSIAEIDMSRNRKLLYKWLGPYRVRKAIPEKGTYILEEFDGTELLGTYAGNRLKKFVAQDCFYIPVTTEFDQDNGSESSKGSEDQGNESADEDLALAENPVRRSARIQQATQQPDTPMRRFVIIPPTLTEEQRREYVRYEEDDAGNLI